MSSYIFTGDWVIDVRFDFLSAGFGIVLCDEIDHSKPLSKFAYLYMLGNNTLQRYERHLNQIATMSEASLITPVVENQHMQIIVENKKLLIKLERTNNAGEDVSEIFGEYSFPYSDENYYIGVYSMAGNILRDITFSAGTPDNWRTNIHNTNGGRVSFFDDGFKFENCLHDAEIEQDNIHLKAGTYYLRYDTDTVADLCDIECVVLNAALPNSTRKDSDFEDSVKQLLTDNKFILKNDTDINVKFKGTSGIIKNISLSSEKFASYIRTHSDGKFGEYSCMLVNLVGLKAVKWTGSVKYVPTR